MTLQAFIYSDEFKEKIASYKALPPAQRTAQFWDNSDDKTLVRLKSELKEFYLKQQDFRCAYCQQRMEVEHLAAWDAEHIISKNNYPLFMFEAENLCISCKDCNTEKLEKNVLRNSGRKRFPKQRDDYIFYHPHFDTYGDEIKVLSDSLFFLPKTPKGRKTIEICGLLRFVFKYANYGSISIELKQEINRLNTALQKTTDPLEEHVLMAQIEEFMKEAKNISRKVAISRIIKRDH